MAYEKELKIGAQIAREAGVLALKIREGTLGIEIKADESPVTAADKACEKLIVEGLSAAFPDDGLLGEEGAMRESKNGRRWIIDPIDGTRAFILGQLHWGTLLGLAENGTPRLGVMHQPYVGETFVGSHLGAELRTSRDSVRLHTRGGTRLADAVLCATDPTMFASSEERAAFGRAAGAARAVRYGGDCYTPCMVAAGYADLVIEAQMKPWDILPLVPIIEAAGGVVSDWSGAPVGHASQVVVACDRGLHREVLNVLNG